MPIESINLFPVTDHEKREELKREIMMRGVVFGKKVKEGRMTKGTAERRIRIMEEILKDYEIEKVRA